MGFPRSFAPPGPEDSDDRRRTAARTGGNGPTLPLLVTVPTGPPQYRSMLAVDIQAFNDQRRGDEIQGVLRATMYALLARTFERSGLDWFECHHEDRGDGVLMIAPSGAPTTALIDPLIDYLRSGLRLHNKLSNNLTRINLRVGAHAGQVYFDGNGVFGQAVSHLFRILNADQFRRSLAESGSEFALMSSGSLYEEVISTGPGLIDPEMFAPIDIEHKETRTRAWLYLPPVPHPYLRRVSSREQPGRTVVEQDQGEGGSRRPARPRLASVTRLPASLPDLRALRPREPVADERPAADRSSIRGSMSAHARLIATSAITRSRRLAGGPGVAARERLRPRQGVQHA